MEISEYKKKLLNEFRKTRLFLCRNINIQIKNIQGITVGECVTIQETNKLNSHAILLESFTRSLLEVLQSEQLVNSVAE